ncbi:PI-PLC X domain-containing protein 3-like [Vespa mandarinia]|uniref:PI-PLC X domain-containing protein 3-like n=1 Tax=Vespa mandarinia TaxID=7446 RepID=UPI00161E0448|nr:PI-PLC X domain-containing protein 3-like [Vespa mandarinia]XP_035742418.1 PI-PLC X domain-containing protein 3-like [Vespa mandarinia]XP_035742420.1 PI-PLC X domain-containing protein 3-like [Vespa mandarinia]XP_035742430.1 PI-PLC X domain-containing protein 3-like [Vespa mandarinia]
MEQKYGIKSEHQCHSEAYSIRTISNDNLEFWMTRLPEPLKKLPIIYLAIPGSHNTMTYTIERRNEVGPDEPAYIRALGRYCSIVSKPVIFNWSVTQKNNVREQLNGGIRYLDLRVATKTRNDNIYFLHGLYGSEVTKPLEDIVRWLNHHANEVIILDFQHFYNFSDMNHRRLVAIINDIFREKLCPTFSSFDHMSLYWLALKRYQVFVIYRNVYAMNHANLWPSALWPTPWPNTVLVDQLVNFLNDKLQKRSSNIPLVSQCLLTPNVSYVMKHLCGNLQSDLAPICQKVILNWISQHKSGSNGLNIVITDFISDKNYLFPKTVIQANLKLLKNL